MKWFLNLKVGQKLLLGFGSCLALALVVGVIAFRSFTHLDEVSDTIAKEAIPGTSSRRARPPRQPTS